MVNLENMEDKKQLSCGSAAEDKKIGRYEDRLFAYPPTLLPSKYFTFSHLKKRAFTLAEVFVVIAIIGIVAALTIANLIKSYQKHVTVSKLKEAYSVLSQTFQASELQNGSVASWDVAGYIQSNVSGAQVWAIIDEMATKYIVPYMKTVESGRKELREFGYKNGIKYADGTIWGSPTASAYCVLLQNGMFVVFALSEHIFNDNPDDKTRTGIMPHVDLDGPNRGPNTIGKDVFVFNKPFSNDLQFSKLTLFHTYDSYLDQRTNTFTYEFTSREKLMEWCKSYGTTCGTLIMRDGWKISDDYPWL